MAYLVFFTIGLSIWHFTVFLPDRFLAGIIGALLGSLSGSVLIGAVYLWLSTNGSNDAGLDTLLLGAVGSIVGLASAYLIGSYRERHER